tara:strand:+ start:124 stop:933 length:810 start_codon:yes stop_codon:yes gene_type:complete
MGFNMKGSPAKLGTIQGTAGHSSALKMKEEANAASALKDLGHGGHPGMTESEAAAADHGGKRSLEERKDANTPKQYTEDKKPYVKKDGKATKNMKDLPLGSKERYAEYESRGWKHDDTTKGGEPTSVTSKSTSTGDGKKVKKTSEGTSSKGDYTKTTKLKTSKKGGATVDGVEGVRKAKTKTKYKEGDRDVKLKTKYDKSGKTTKEKKTVKEGGVVTKTITKAAKGDGDAATTTRTKTRKKGGTGLGSWAKKQLAKRALKRATKRVYNI